MAKSQCGDNDFYSLGSKAVSPPSPPDILATRQCLLQVLLTLWLQGNVSISVSAVSAEFTKASLPPSPEAGESGKNQVKKQVKHMAWIYLSEPVELV